MILSARSGRKAASAPSVCEGVSPALSPSIAPRATSPGAPVPGSAPGPRSQKRAPARARCARSPPDPRPRTRAAALPPTRTSGCSGREASPPRRGARRQHQIEGRRLSRHPEVVQRIESKWTSTQGPLFGSLKTRRSWMRTGSPAKPMSLPTDPANIPWIPLGPGESFKPLRFLPGDRGRVLPPGLEPGRLVPPHRHGGEVHGYNVSGSRKLLETGEIVGPGVYVYEPPGNVDSWMAVGDEPVVVHITA